MRPLLPLHRLSHKNVEKGTNVDEEETEDETVVLEGTELENKSSKQKKSNKANKRTSSSRSPVPLQCSLHHLPFLLLAPLLGISSPLVLSSQLLESLLLTLQRRFTRPSTKLTPSLNAWGWPRPPEQFNDWRYLRLQGALTHAHESVKGSTPRKKFPSSVLPRRKTSTCS